MNAISCVHCARTLKLLNSFVTQGDKEEIVTETIEEPVSLSRMLALLLCWLPFSLSPCITKESSSFKTWALQAKVEVLFELKRLTGKYSVNHKVESFVELISYDIGQVNNNDWRELEHWMHLLNNRWRKEVMVSQPIQITLAVKSAMVDPFCIEVEVFKVF